MSGGEVFVFDVRICQSYQMTIAVTIRQPVTIGFYCVVANLPRGNFPPATTIRQSVMGLSQTGRGEERMVHSHQTDCSCTNHCYADNILRLQSGPG